MVPRGDDGEDRRFSQRKWQTLDRTGVHDESYHRGVTIAKGSQRNEMDITPSSIGRFVVAAAATAGYLMSGTSTQPTPDVRAPQSSVARPTGANTIPDSGFAEKLQERMKRAPTPARGRNPFAYGSRAVAAPREVAEPLPPPMPVNIEPPLPVFKLSGIAATQTTDGKALTAIVIDNGTLVFVKAGDKLSNGYSVVSVDEMSVTLIDASGVTQTLRLP